jgi:geranylgeranyl pyrophosphate synthase
MQKRPRCLKHRPVSGMVSEVDERTIEAMRQYGYGIGMAFQIIDDILDFTGEQTTMGNR